MIEQEEAEPELIRIESVAVVGLFGLYDHLIPLNLDERVTIIHGPNGVGKTRMLSWIAALFRLDFEAFAHVPFQTFTVSFTDGTTLSLEPVDDDQLKLSYTGPTLAPQQHVFRRGDARALKTEPRQGLVFQGLPFGRSKPMPFPAWIKGAIGGVAAHLVEVQRLLRQGIGEDDGFDFDGQLVPTVDDHARDLQRRIREALAEYASTSQSLDQSFPQRLIAHQASTADVDALKRRMTTLQGTREQLAKIGLLGAEERAHPFDVSTLDRLEPERRLVLALYVEDSEIKLRTLEDFARRIQIFLETINEKFSNKRLRIDAKAGLVAEDHGGRRLALDALSSGEQHEIAVLYPLLFNVRPNTLVLIDEPELSLHITWQKRFLDDLLRIAKTVGIDALVATHSPFIIGEHEDLMVPLDDTPDHRLASQ